MGMIRLAVEGTKVALGFVISETAANRGRLLADGVEASAYAYLEGRLAGKSNAEIRRDIAAEWANVTAQKALARFVPPLS